MRKNCRCKNHFTESRADDIAVESTPFRNRKRNRAQISSPPKQSSMQSSRMYFVIATVAVALALENISFAQSQARSSCQTAPRTAATLQYIAQRNIHGECQSRVLSVTVLPLHCRYLLHDVGF